MTAPILVTGGSGQLAQALGAAGGAAVRIVGRPDLDFDRPDTIPALLRDAAPRAIVNAAAYTAVDRAETEPEAAMRANRDGPALLAEYAQAAGIPFIHVSTDYVFDGRKGAPYVETDPTGPACVYGATKLEGERAVLAACPGAVILRTSWVYAPRGKNFVLTMLNAARKTDRLRVVADQIGCPTAAADLADAILAILARPSIDGAGVFHAAGTGWTSWHGLAVAVFAEAARHGLRAPTVDPITTADWPTPASRPADSRLDCDRLAHVFGIRLPAWQISIARTIDDVFTAS